MEVLGLAHVTEFLSHNCILDTHLNPKVTVQLDYSVSQGFLASRISVGYFSKRNTGFTSLVLSAIIYHYDVKVHNLLR